MIKCKIRTCIRSTAIVAFAATAFSAHAATMSIEDSDTGFRSISSTVTARSTSSETPSKTVKLTNELQSAMVLNQFDASLGTLTAIEITGRVNASVSFGTVSVVCRDDGAINSDCGSESGSQSGSSSAGVDIPFDGSTTFFPISTKTIAPSEFANFIGTGTVLVPWRVSYSHTVRAFCNPTYTTSIELCQATGRITFTYRASTQIKYIYEEPVVNAVPLPAGMPLLLAGLGGLAFLRRRR